MLIKIKSKKAGAFISFIIIILTIILVVFSGVFQSTIATKIYPSEHLFIDETILLKTNETNKTVDINCILYLTNIWEKNSGKINAAAYVIETNNNFAISENEIKIGIIKENSTTKIVLPVVLSNSSYKVKVLLFENEKLVIKGELLISAYPIYSWEDISHGRVKNQVWNVNNYDMYFEQIH